MDLDFVNVFKMGLPAIVIVLLLNHDSSVVVELAPELNVISKLDSEVVASTKRVKHPSCAKLISNCSSTFTSKIDDINTILTQD